jgi:hypothetical protein
MEIPTQLVPQTPRDRGINLTDLSRGVGEKFCL